MAVGRTSRRCMSCQAADGGAIIPMVVVADWKSIKLCHQLHFCSTYGLPCVGVMF